MSTTGDWRELTVRQAAGRAHRAEETIRRWIWSGKLPARKLGRGYQVRTTDLDAVAGGLTASRKPDTREFGLAQWLDEFWRWREGNGVPVRGGTGQLVVEDRAERSGLAGS